MLQGIFDSMLLDPVEDLHRSLAKRGKENLFCPVCRRVAYAPQILPCSHIFCEECLREKLRKDKRCPFKGCLRQSVPVSVEDCRPLGEVDPGAERVRGMIRVKCRLFGRGCRWKGVVRELIPHREVCRFATVQCHNKGCGEKMERREMKQHAAECQFRRQVMRCPFCGGVELEHGPLQAHCEMQCPAFHGWVLLGISWVWACPSVGHAQRLSCGAVTLAKRIAKLRAEEEGRRMNAEAAAALIAARETKAKALASGENVEAAEEAFVQATVNVGKAANKAESFVLLTIQAAGEQALQRTKATITRTKKEQAQVRDARHTAETKTDIFFWTQRGCPARHGKIPSMEEISRRAAASAEKTKMC